MDKCKDTIIEGKSNGTAEDKLRQLVAHRSKAPVIASTGDRVNHPSHYTWLKDLCGIEVIDITRHMGFDLGNAIKYILRSGLKLEEGLSSREKTIEDLRKAVWYIEDEIKMLEKV